MKEFFKQLIEDMILSLSSEEYARKRVLEQWDRED